MEVGIFILLAGILWEVISLVSVARNAVEKLGDIGSALSTIDTELSRIRSDLADFDTKLNDIGYIHNEMQWHKKDSSAAKVLKQLDAIESAIQQLEMS